MPLEIRKKTVRKLETLSMPICHKGVSKVFCDDETHQMI